MLPKKRTKPKMGVRQSSVIRSEPHKQWIRTHRCCIEGVGDHVCMGNMECMHVRGGSGTGMSAKPGDDRTIPGCMLAHRTQHDLGEAEFQRRYSFSMLEMAQELWCRSPARKKMEMK